MTDIPVNSRIALQNGTDDVYLFALAGTEGWARDVKRDDDGFDMVNVEWDKSHWRYNGQPDGWTFANHFKVVGPPSAPVEDSSAEESSEMELFKMPPSEDEIGRYMETLESAMDAASEAEGFIVITIKRLPNPENPEEMLYAPSVFEHAVSKEASMLLDVQLAEVASANYQEMILNMIAAMNNEG